MALQRRAVAREAAAGQHDGIGREIHAFSGSIAAGQRGDRAIDVVRNGVRVEIAEDADAGCLRRLRQSRDERGAASDRPIAGRGSQIIGYLLEGDAYPSSHAMAG
jgi:hypothetical protein